MVVLFCIRLSIVSMTRREDEDVSTALKHYFVKVRNRFELIAEGLVGLKGKDFIPQWESVRDSIMSGVAVGRVCEKEYETTLVWCSL